MQNRRNFLKNGLIAVTGAGLAGKSISEVPRQLNTAKNPEFVYRTLGKTGIKIPVVSMGTGNTSNPNLVRAAYDKGVKLFATSEYYQNGNNEKMIGEALKDRPRDSYMLMTGTPTGISIDYKNGLFKDDTDIEVFMEHTHGCLKRLQVDYIDILSVGFGATRQSVFYEPVLEAVKKFKAEGKARYLGLATHSFEPEAIRAAVDTGVYDVVTVAYNFRKTNVKETEEALQYAADAGLGIIGMKNMAGAYWDKEKTQPINTIAALKWVLRNENIHTVIPDCANYDHLDKDLAIMGEMELTEKEKNDLNPPSEDLASGLYCQQCHECISQCPENLDIPTIMRSYMYAYGYKNLEQARQTIDLANLSGEPCKDCMACQVSCAMNFNIREKINDIARIREIPPDLIHHV
jgi:predicted aldo/keto reductase-like oxidoreductase